MGGRGAQRGACVGGKGSGAGAGFVKLAAHRLATGRLYRAVVELGLHRRENTPRADPYTTASGYEATVGKVHIHEIEGATVGDDGVA